MTTFPNPNVRPKIDCSQATFWMISSGLSIIRTVSTPDSSMTRCVVTAQRSARHSSHFHSPPATPARSAAPAAIRSAPSGRRNEAPKAPARKSTTMAGPASLIGCRRTISSSCSPGRRRDRIYFSASAPLTTSRISLVIDACRILFIFSVRLSIISVALRVALSIAVIRAPCSAAADSSRAR